MTDKLGRKLIKIQRNGDEYRFTWSQGNEILQLKSNERPLPELPHELDKILPYALENSAIDKKYHAKTVVSGIVFDWKGDDNRRNAVVHMATDMGMNGYLPAQSIKKLADNHLDEKKKGRWDTNAVAQFDKIQEQAFEYIDGNRSQQTMPLMEPKKGKKGKANDKQLSLDSELSQD